MFFTIVNDPADEDFGSENERRFLSYLGRAEAVPCPPRAAPPPRPPKPSQQALNLFAWRQQQEQQLERIRAFGHDSLVPPARPPKGEGEDPALPLPLLPTASPPWGGGLLLPLASPPPPRRSPSKPPAPDPPEENWELSPRELLKLVNPSPWPAFLENSHPLLPPPLPHRAVPLSCSSLSSLHSSPSSSSSPLCEEFEPPEAASWPRPQPATPEPGAPELQAKKSELAGKIRRRIEEAEKRKVELAEEAEVNDDTGQELQGALAGAAPVAEVERYRGHVGEVETVTSLLLCLAGRLARTEGEAGEEAAGKRGKLLEQLEEAKGLKRRIDRRGEAIGRRLGEVLGPDRTAEYSGFLRRKERLVVERREVEERLRLARDQLRALL